MEPSGARTRSSGSTKFSESTLICGWRFNGAGVSVGITVEVGGSGVAVWVITGEDIVEAVVGVERIGIGAGATVPQAEVISNGTNAMLFRNHFITSIYKFFKISARFSSYSVSLIKLAARNSFSSFILATTCSE